MHFSEFEALKLSIGDLIHVMNEKGELLVGQYLGGYDRGNERFTFNNYGNGQTEIVHLNLVQMLRRA